MHRMKKKLCIIECKRKDNWWIKTHLEVPKKHEKNFHKIINVTTHKNKSKRNWHHAKKKSASKKNSK